MKVYTDVDFYIPKHKLAGKQQSKNFRKTQKNDNLLKIIQVYWKPKNMQNGGSVFTFRWSGERFAPLYPCQLHRCYRPVLYPFTVQE